MGFPFAFRARLVRLWIMSSLALLCALPASPLRGHEILPAIAEIRLSEDRAEITLSATLEALVAGLDLEGIEDTNAASGADRYDALRAMAPGALREALTDAWPRIEGTITLRAGAARVPLQLAGSTVPEVGNPALPRESSLLLRADLPNDGSPVVFGWDGANGPLVVRQVSGTAEYAEYLTDGALSAPLPRAGAASKPWPEVFGRYVVLGFEHIIPKGLDHILFVLGLFFFALRLRPLLYQVTAFTLAHTVTLALAVTGVVRVSPGIVEPLIAASIVFVAVENILSTRMTPWRTAIVFVFGLLHGLGFASVLGEIGLAPGRLVTGLLGFNIGVELGQLAVIAIALALVGWAARKPWYRALISTPASAGIAAVGAWWFVERVFF